jgi:hypothetical protein
MPVLNEGLTSADFKPGPQARYAWSMRPSDLNGFLGRPRVVTLTGGFSIFKLTGDQQGSYAPEDPRFGVTPWWSTVRPWNEDREGAAGRYEQAVLNGIDLSSMVRYMSAVVVGWNSLSHYVEVTIKPGWDVLCFWGKFAPMKLIGGPDDVDKSAAYSQTSSPGYSEAVLPEDIGALEAWQLYIPGLKNEHLLGGSARLTIDAHDMDALGRHFGVASVASAGRAATKMPSPEEFMRATMFSQVQARSPLLKRMDDVLKQFRQACPSLTPNIHNAQQRQLLSQFCTDGELYKAQSRDPMKVKLAVENAVKIARDWLR